MNEEEDIKEGTIPKIIVDTIRKNTMTDMPINRLEVLTV